MAEVDFSNARIEPYAYTPIGSTHYNPVNPTYRENVSLNQSTLYSRDFGTIIAPGAKVTQLVNLQKQLIYLYQGTFTQSGTEFYILNYSGSGYMSTCWRVSNISFNSGDTYTFTINATLTCN